MKFYNQTFEGRRENTRPSQAFSRLYAAARRAQPTSGKGQQKVTVEHVHVQVGGQALVGMVASPAGGDRGKSKDQPQAKQIARRPQAHRWPAKRTWDPGPVSEEIAFVPGRLLSIRPCVTLNVNDMICVGTKPPGASFRSVAETSRERAELPALGCWVGKNERKPAFECSRYGRWPW